MKINKKSSSALDRLINEMPSHLSIIVSTYQGMGKQALFIDEEYGQFSATPDNIKQGHGHMLRGSIIGGLKRRQNSLKKYLKNLPKDVEMDIDTYKGLNKPARFIDKEYGEWWTSARHVLEKGCGHPKRRGQNISKTIMARYGVKHALQKREFFQLAATSMNKYVEKFHWKTGLSINCVGSYEAFIVDYLNSNKIEYLWQPKSFDLPVFTKSGSNVQYTPDLYLIREDLWIEIKGKFWGDAKSKWDMFCAIISNNELWDYNTLRKMGYSPKRHKIV